MSSASAWLVLLRCVCLCLFRKQSGHKRPVNVVAVSPLPNEDKVSVLSTVAMLCVIVSS